MTLMNRRNFLRAAAATAALGPFPPAIQRALAIPANNATGTINDVEHVIILMQENRSFDHYYGTMPGVRGFSDRFTIPMASGQPVWIQQGTSGTVQPYYLDATKGNALRVGGAHNWADQQAAWDGGRMAAWPRAKNTKVAMGYLQQSDLAFHWSLANAFTVCDAYHTAINTGTFTNRMFLWSGTNGANVTDHACVTNANWGGLGPSQDGLDWMTYPERLQAAGVSWKVYNTPGNNSNNNQLVAFAAYRAVNERLAAVGSPSAPYTPSMEAMSPLYKGYGNTMPDGGYLQAIADDIAMGTLPQVSWIVAPGPYSEHPSMSVPGQGAWFVEKLLETLTANPDVWSKTVLILNYDENDCFFDHMPPPAPPWRDADGAQSGKSTVDIEKEYYTMPAPPGDTSKVTPDGRPFGAGPRLPTLVISPWSVGGWVNSQQFDHTSVLRFLEQRFGVAEPNISAWRRAVFGDMMSCFNFKDPNTAKPMLTPAPTRAEADATLAQQVGSGTVPVPDVGTVPLPTQARLVRPSRALPYHLHTSANVDASAGQVWLTFSNTGAQGTVFHVYDELNLARYPRRYTVEGRKMISDSWQATADNAGRYSLWVLGPNGYHRGFKGDISALGGGPNPEVRVCYDERGRAVSLTIMNMGTAPATVTVQANAYRADGPWTYTVDPGMQVEPRWSVEATNNWYDFTVTMGSDFERRFAGRMETGQDSTSDPAMGVV
ncbi:phospholipase C, phosphocholine-specific [Achromobacter sp. LC458]|uniref:phosphocholine-specific phospholipase C n=1 Tax=Achromobacter sp. LC458 TaxID=1120623 RepID=UPI000629E605|nr:phospholipase C, phosphocholine-specific [Achromobacter sp. LC458]TRM52358.1 phospholipase C, phosphocholine-specific [Achromobacter sp. LC458]